MPRMTGAKYLAETLKAYGVSHVFLVPAVLRKSLAEMDMVGIKRVVTPVSYTHLRAHET